jgi:hypothetical protein
MKKTVRKNPDGFEEVTRDSQIIYSEKVNLEEVNFVEVVNEIMQEVPRHLAWDATVHLVAGDLSIYATVKLVKTWTG